MKDKNEQNKGWEGGGWDPNPPPPTGSVVKVH